MENNKEIPSFTAEEIEKFMEDARNMEMILSYLNNYFFEFAEEGTYKIENFLLSGAKGNYQAEQYIKIEGSVRNDGIFHVHSYLENKLLIPELVNEEFEGTIYALAVPTYVLKMAGYIEEFNKKNKPSIMNAESFGNYSYSKSTNKNNEVSNWINAFSTYLAPYRKIYNGKGRVKFI